MGPEGVKVPAQTQALLGGGKQVRDLVGENFSLAVDGTTLKAAGDVKNIEAEWTEFDSKNNTGHFVPLQLPAKCSGQKISIEGRSAGKRTVKVDEDLLLIQRLENLSADSMTIKMGDELLMTVDFSGVNRK